MGLKTFASNLKQLWKPDNKLTIPKKVKSVGWNEFFGSGAGSDAWRKQQKPDRIKLIDEYKGTIYACIQENATPVMSATLRAYRKSSKSKTKSLYATKSLDLFSQNRITKAANLRLADGEQLQEITNHPLLNLLDKPNPFTIGRNLAELTQVFQEICGAAYWYVQKNALGTPSGIYLLYSQYVWTIRDKQTGFPLFYEYGIGEGKERYELDEIVPFILPSPYDPMLTRMDGYSPLLSVFEQTEILDFFNATQAALLQNEGQPYGILSFKDGINEDEAEKVRHKFNQKNRRAGSGNVLVIDEDASFTPLSWAPKDLGRLKIKDSVDEAICMAFDVPAALYAKELGTYQAYATAVESHTDRAVKPRLDRNQSVLNMYLVPMFDHSDLILVYDDPSPKNKEQQLAEDHQYVVDGVRTPNEIRKDHGWDEKPWGDKPAGMFSQDASDKPTDKPGNQEPAAPDAPQDTADGSIPDSDGGTANEPAPQTGEVEQAQSALMGMVGGVAAALQILEGLSAGEIQRDTAIQLFIMFYHLTPAEAEAIVGEPLPPKPVSEPPSIAPEPSDGQSDPKHPPEQGKPPIEPPEPPAKRIKAHSVGHSKALPDGKELAEVVRGFFDKQAKWVLSHLDGKGKSVKASLPTSFVDLDDWSKDLYRDSLPVIEAYAKDGYSESVKDLIRVGASPDAFSVSNPKLIDGVKKATYKFAESTNSTTSLAINDALKDLREQISEGLIEEGDSIDQLSKRVNKIFDGAEANRAKLIAQTEASRAHHEGLRQAAKDSGVATGFKLLLSSDPCPLCEEVAANNPETDLDGKFNEDNDYDDSLLPIHPFCKCTALVLTGDPQVDGGENEGGE